jgi:hypothetical protein
MDGKLDILSGCYWTEGTDAGQIQILKGVDTLDFEKSISLLSSAEKPLENVKLGDQPDAGGMDSNQTKNICTQQHAVDYDGDGDLDLVVGCFANNFFLYENEGSSTENQLVEKPVELELVSPDYHAAPHLVDFDGDGDLDFLTGGGSGGAYIAINEGDAKTPKYGKFMSLMGKPKSPYEPQRPGAISVGGGTRIWATDFNGDGLMDLLVGDNVQTAGPADGVSEEDYLAKKAMHDKKLARLMGRYQELMEAGREMGDEAQEKFWNVYSELGEESEKFEEADSTGFVWLLLQKPKLEPGKDVTQN